MSLRKALHLIACTAISLAVQGCFTGVESTPRIELPKDRYEKVEQARAERTYLASVRPLPPSQWAPGRKFRVADERVTRIFTPPGASAEGLANTDIVYLGAKPARTLTGDDGMELSFAAADGRVLTHFPAGIDQTRFDTIASLEIPFLIDLDMVAATDSMLRGRELYVRTNAWYDKDRQAVNGLRHIRVRIDSVVPGNENFYAAVFFTPLEQAKDTHAMVFMSNGQALSATRNFDTLFSFDNPRKNYPEINDHTWSLIIASKIEKGMSRDEARLALGSPVEVLRVPTYGGMRERWTYTDGVFLVFDDGFITTFRQ